MATEEIVRYYRFALDPNPETLKALERYAGASRWAFNHAHAHLLDQYRAFDERVQVHAQELSGLSAEDIAETLPKTERVKLFKQARTIVQGENRERCKDLKIIDEHRKRVVHKGAPTLDPGELDEDASPMARELHARRVELAAVQASDPKQYAKLKKAELADVRPQVLKLKKQLVSEGAYRPGGMDIEALWRSTRDLPKDQGGSPWYSGINVYAFTSGFGRADEAWKNFMNSAAGKRAGKRVGMPRFKKKGRARDSFALYHDVKNPAIRLDDPRHLTMPGIGTVRLEAHARRLRRVLRRGQAVISSVTVTRGAHRWYASVLCRVQQEIPDRPTKRQRANGLVAVDLGSQPLAVLSAPLDIADPESRYFAADKPGAAASKRLARAQRALSRCAKGSKRRRQAAQRVAKIHHLTAERRATHLHHVSKRLATGAAAIAIEGFDLTELTASARGTMDAPGTDVKVRSQFNRSLLDSGLGDLRQQLAYKTRWNGSTLVVLDKNEPTATKCSKCDTRNPTVTPGHKRFNCPSCGHDVDRRHNAAASILKAARREYASVAPDRGDTQNARGGAANPVPETEPAATPMKRPPPA
ncbi:RNA-guided endonuclease TnpB family protein [Streptomyces noursei]|uniref:RNA-guided endonuclease TnpB family protein n=1 Tax=Streptomyces noursei TaxID=1971 RepID=UPI00345018C4